LGDLSRLSGSSGGLDHDSSLSRTNRFQQRLPDLLNGQILRHPKTLKVTTLFFEPSLRPSTCPQPEKTFAIFRFSIDDSCMSSGKKDGWGSSLGIILAVTGSAVGLGNFLRFPGLAAKYDGGAFLIPYFLALLFLGLPIAWSEWAMGRYGGQRGFNSCPGIFRTIWKSRLAPYCGVLGLLVPVVIYMYYLWIESWCLGYALKYLAGGLNLGPEKAAYTDHFTSYVGLGADGAFFHQGMTLPVACLLACVALNFFIIYRGLSGGIEKVCLWGMPLLVICALLVLVRVLTLGTPDPAHPDRNVIAGLGYMWDIRGGLPGLLKSLSNAEMWMAAAGQIFFSLSVGFGVVINYASYLKKRDDIALGSTTAVAGNEFCEVTLGGLTTIPAAFLFLGAAGAVGGTFGLGFQTLPLVFDRMPLGQLFGFLWFFLLFIAAITIPSASSGSSP